MKTHKTEGRSGHIAAHANKTSGIAKLSCLALLLALASALHAGTYTWDVRSGLLPDQVDETMRLVNNRATNSPVLSGDGLLISTDATNYEASMYYTQDATNLAMPTQLVIEAEVKFVAEADASPGDIRDSGVAIGFITATGLGNNLFIRSTNISLWVNDGGGNSAQPGPATNVPTADSFHRCRIEVDNPTVSGSATRVFWDDTLVLNGGVYYPLPGSGSTNNSEIWFGDGSSGNSGTSYWRYFRHNAAAQTAGARVSIATAVELYWWAATNSTYQVQWKPGLGTNDWMDLGAPIAGDDSIKSVFDSTRGAPQKVYRVNSQ